MKIYEVYEKQLNEFNPLSKRSRELRRYQKAGKKDLQATAQNLENEYASYLGMQDTKPRNAGYNELNAFLRSKGISANIDTSVPYNNKRVNQIFTKLSRDAMTGKGSQSAAKKPSATKAKDKKPAASAAPEKSKASSAKPSSNYSKLKTSAMQMSAKEKRRLIQALQKDVDSRSRSGSTDNKQPGEFKTQRSKGKFQTSRGQK